MARATVILLAAACGGDATPDKETATPPCGTVIDETWPADGATDAYYRDPVEVYLDEADPTAQIVADFPGTLTTRDDGATLVYTPDPALSPDTEYTYAIAYCRGEPSITFRTSAAGLPVEDPAGLVGNTYLVDLSEGRFMAGADLGVALSGIFARSLLLQILEVDGDTVRVRTGVTTPRDEPLAQDTCYRTSELSMVDFSAAPDFSVAVPAFSFGAYGTELTLYDLEVAGTVTPDGGAVEGLRYQMTLAVAELREIIGASDDEAMCSWAESLGAPCAPCPAPEAGDCVTLIADRITAPEVGIDLVEVLVADAEKDCLEPK